MANGSQSPRAAREVFGYILLALGGLWLFLTGTCTLLFASGFLLSGDIGSVGTSLVVGAPAILLGVGVFLLGRRLLS